MAGMVMNSLLKSYHNKNVLVTGHTGFKGSWLSIWLDMLGAKVSGIALDPINSKDNFELAKVSSFVNDYRGDIRDKDLLLEYFQHQKPEIVFHLAAQPLVLDSYQDPLTTFETNIMGTAHILEAVRLTPSVKTVVIITTDKVYENKEWIWPYREDERLGGYDPYSASKGASEIVISSYRNSFFHPDKHHIHGKSIASARAGNVIGGGDWSDNRIIPDCIKAFEKKQALGIRSPKSIRPWQHVLDPLGGYLLLGASMMKDPKKYAEAWNFGPEADNIVNVEYLVELAIKHYGSGSWNDLSEPNALHEAKLLSLDINKAKSILNWKPILNIEETIRYTMDWYTNYESKDVLNLCKTQIKQYFDLWNSKG